MKKREDYPVYLKYLQSYLDDDNRSFRKYKNSTELSQAEKKLFLARELFIDAKWDEAIETLDSIHTQCIFLKGEKEMLHATALINLSRYEEGVIVSTRALKIANHLNDRQQLYTVNYNLSCHYSNLGMREAALFFLQEAGEHAVQEFEKISIQRGLAFFHSALGHKEKAMEIIEEARPLELSNESHACLAFKWVTAEILFGAGREQEALECLKQILASKLTWQKEEVSFEYHLIKSYLENNPLGTAPSSIEGREKLLMQWNIIKSVQDGDLETARKDWKNLMKISPNLYGENFKSKSPETDNSIFMKVLKSKFVESKKAVVAAPELKSKKLKSLYELLANAKTPLRKEHIIEMVWKTDYCPSLDSRFYQLIKRLRPLISQEIVNKNNAYYLSDVEDEKLAA